MADQTPKSKETWWSSLPNVLKEAAAVITAIGVIYLGYLQYTRQAPADPSPPPLIVGTTTTDRPTAGPAGPATTPDRPESTPPPAVNPQPPTPTLLVSTPTRGPRLCADDPLFTPGPNDPDGDGLTTAAERSSVPTTSPTDRDTDGDELSDGWELGITGTSPTKADTDGDGLTDFEEACELGTDPHNPDSDGDSASDATEVAVGMDPKSRDTDAIP